MTIARPSPTQSALSEAEKFHQAVIAIENHDTQTIKNAIRTDPNIFLKKDKTGYTLLHYAATAANVECLELILNHLKKQHKLAKVAGVHDRDGENVLHMAATYNSAAVVKCLVTALGDQAIQLAKVTNNRGLIPIKCAAQNLDRNQTEPIQATLFPLLLDYSAKPQLDPVDINTVLKAHPKCSSALEKNLRLACKAINLARKSIIHCQTIPASQFYKTAKDSEFKLTKEKIQERKAAESEQKKHIDAVRKELDPIWNKLKDKKTNTFQEKKREIEKGAKIIEKHRAGNCEELALLTLHHVCTEPLSEQLAADITSFLGVDHVYNIFGHDPEHTDFNDPDTWPDEMVVADALTGRVIQAKKIFSECMIYLAFVKAGLTYSTLAYVNSNFHQIYSALSVQLPRSTPTVATNTSALFTLPQNISKTNLAPPEEARRVSSLVSRFEKLSGH